MLTLENDALVFRFPTLHEDAVLRVELQRTLRIPDDGKSYPLPPGLGRFPMRHVDDHAGRVPGAWKRHGGVLVPMYQAEAAWINFSSPAGYPMAVKVGAGKINAMNGRQWESGLRKARANDEQGYVVVPEQPWLDGYVVGAGQVRQFVAMPLGAGYSAEEQITGRGEHGGLQLEVYPLSPAVWDRILRERGRARHDEVLYSKCYSSPAADMAMGMGAGGSMRQEIYTDDRPFGEWQTDTRSRCFIHLTNALVWRAVTGSAPPTTPPTAPEYTKRGLPWFDYYASDQGVVAGSDILERIRSVLDIGRAKGDVPLPENESVEPSRVVEIGDERTPGRVREGEF